MIFSARGGIPFSCITFNIIYLIQAHSSPTHKNWNQTKSRIRMGTSRQNQIESRRTQKVVIGEHTKSDKTFVTGKYSGSRLHIIHFTEGVPHRTPGPRPRFQCWQWNSECSRAKLKKTTISVKHAWTPELIHNLEVWGRGGRVEKKQIHEMGVI